MKRLTARDVMNPEVLAVRVDLTLSELAAFFAEKQITGAPVADRDGRLVGVVSLMDLAENHATRTNVVGDQARPHFWVRGWEDKMSDEETRALHLEDEDLLVGDIMTPAVYSVPEDTPVPSLARTMLAGRIHRLLVTQRGRVVGIVTTMDLLKLLCDDERARADDPARGPAPGRRAVKRKAFARRRTSPQDPR